MLYYYTSFSGTGRICSATNHVVNRAVVEAPDAETAERACSRIFHDDGRQKRVVPHSPNPRVPVLIRVAAGIATYLGRAAAGQPAPEITVAID